MEKSALTKTATSRLKFIRKGVSDELANLLSPRFSSLQSILFLFLFLFFLVSRFSRSVSSRHKLRRKALGRISFVYDEKCWPLREQTVRSWILSRVLFRWRKVFGQVGYVDGQEGRRQTERSFCSHFALKAAIQIAHLTLATCAPTKPQADSPVAQQALSCSLSLSFYFRSGAFLPVSVAANNILCCAPKQVEAVRFSRLHSLRNAANSALLVSHDSRQ